MVRELGAAEPENEIVELKSPHVLQSVRTTLDITIQAVFPSAASSDS